ncbi:uncharacterized protein LOC141852175 [Brevipalpus obovatus]|uniref:uncharacterized protein LOC141852175 n=1 Tax=Brevipalpus obovatus TaxID=246614 RepID=UPI003D9F7956
MLVKFSLALLLAIFSAEFVSGTKNCSQAVQKMDDTFKTAIFIKQGLKIPANDKEISHHCTLGKQFLKDAKGFSSCSKPFPNQVITILGKSLVKTTKSMCKAGKERTRLTNFLECMTPEYHSTAQKIGLLMVNQLYTLSKNVTNEQMFPLICCSFNTLISSMRTVPEPKCKTSIKLNDYLIEQVNRLIKDLTDLLCGKWSTPADCERAEPQLFERMNQIRDAGNFLNDQSLIGTILDVVEKLS